MQDENIQDVATSESISENAKSPETSQSLAAPDPTVKYDWFKGELAGLNQNLADLYHQGFTPELQEMGKADDYWSDVNIRAPFEQRYGENAKAEFDKVYKASEDKLKAYTDHHFDIRYTSFSKVPVRTQVTDRLEKMGLVTISDPKAMGEFVNFPEYVDPWGRSVKSYDYGTQALSLTEPKFGWREGAKTVYDAENNTFIPVEEYLQKNPGANLVHAANEDGSPAVGPDSLNYLRPLKYGEDKKTYEEYYSGKEDWLGSKGLYRSDWYALQWLPKNAFNFMGDTLDSGAEFLKVFDNLWQSGDQSSWDKALTEFQNDVNSVLYVPTSEQGREHWYTVEGISDGLAQIGAQVFGMKGVGWGIKSLTALTKLGKGTRAAQIGSQLWMATLASDDIAKEGRENGLSPKEIAVAYTLYTAGVYKIAGLSERIINPVTTKALQGQIIRDFTKQLGVAKQVGGGKISLPGMFQAVKNGITKLDDGLTNLLTSESKAAQLTGAGLGEFVEEETEVFWDKGFKEGYNAIWGPYAGDDDFKALTDPNKDARFKVSWENLPAELAAAGVLGFGGGGLFKAVDLFSNNSEKKRKTIIGYGAYGEGYEGLRKRANDDWNNDRILPGQRKVDVYGKPTDKVEESRAYLAYKAITNEIDMAEGLWKNYKADQTYANNLKKLGADELGNTILSNYSKVMGEDADLRNTDLPKYLVDTLEEISQLEGKLTFKEGVSQEEANKNQERLKTLKDNLADVVSGKNANEYLLQSLFNADKNLGYKLRESLPENKRLTFQEFNGANNYFKTRQDELSGIVTNTDNINLQKALEQKIKIIDGGDVYKKFEEEINDKYFDENGSPRLDVSQEDYFSEIAQLKSLVYNKSTNPIDDFKYTITQNGLPGADFETIIKNFENDRDKSIQDGSIIFDDVEKIDAVTDQLNKRFAQLLAMVEVNPKANVVFQTDASSKNKFPIITNEDVGKVNEILSGYLGRVQSLRDTAVENQENFFKSSNKASDNQMLFTSKTLGNIADLINKEGSYKDLLPLIEEDLVALVSATDKNNFELYHSKVTQAIHNYFKDKQQEAILKFMTYLKSDILTLGQYDNFTYLKAIITLDPKVFKAAYKEALDSMLLTPKDRDVADMRTPFPAQDRNIYRIAAWLSSKINPLANLVDENANEYYRKSGKYHALTESYFLQDEQGSGKTLVALMGLKIAQMRNGGKGVIFASNNEIRKKAYVEATKNFKIDVDVHVGEEGKNYTADDILNYIQEGDGKNLTDVRYIVIDEATLYSIEALEKIDMQIRDINKKNYMGQGQVPIKILLMGDPMQTGFINEKNDGYNVGDEGHTVERSEMTRFSWRTGNQDILEVLRHIRSAINLQGRVSETVVKYDKAKKSGYMTTDNFEDSVITMIKDKEVAESYIVITDDHEMKAKLRARGVPEQNIMTPSQAQGMERNFIFVNLPISQSEFEYGADNLVRKSRLKPLLTAIGRAKKMVIANSNPALKIRNVEGESILKDTVFKPEELKTLRDQRIEALDYAGVKGFNAKDVTLNSPPLVMTRVVETIERQDKPVTTDDANKWLEFVKSLNEVGENAQIATFYTKGFTYDDSGNESPMSAQDALRIKNQITSSTNPLPMEADAVNFILQYQRGEIASEVFDTYSEAADEKLRNQPKLILIARLMRNGNKLADVTFGALQGVNPELPIDKDGKRVIALEYSPQQSTDILHALKTNRKDASTETVDPFTESRKNRRTAAENEMNRKKITALDFMRNNPSHNYASAVWQVTLGPVGRGGTQRVPYLFYSYDKTRQEIDDILYQFQLTNTMLQKRVGEKGITPTGRNIVRESLTGLREKGVLGIALDGGRQVPLKDFLEGSANEFKTGVKADKRKFDISNAGRAAIRNFINDVLELDIADKDRNGGAVINEKVFGKLKKKKFNSKYKQYIADSTKYSIGLVKQDVVQDEEERIDSDAEDKKSKSKKTRGVKISAKLSFKPLVFLNKIYNDLNDADKKRDAEKLIAQLEKDIFKYGVYASSPTVRESTTDTDVAFGRAELGFENFSVAGYTSPGMPIFKIPMSLLTSGSEENVRQFEINRIQTINSFPVNQDRKDVISQPVIVPKDSDFDPALPRTFDEMQPKSDNGVAVQFADIVKIWFKGSVNSVYVEEFGFYFKDKIYSTIFPLVGESPVGIVTSDRVNEAIKIFKEQVTTEGLKTINSISEQVPNLTITEFADSYLNSTKNAEINPTTGYNRLREIYYKVVMAYHFEDLLPHYFESIGKINGEYSFVNKSYKHNPAAQQEIKPHLATGSSIAKMHLFNTPLIEINAKTGQYYSQRRLNKEDYAIIIRDMQDNDITSIPKALAYFSPENKGVGSRGQQIKFSFYQRFLSPNPLVINGQKHHSLLSASSGSPRQIKDANNSVTALLSFLASGNEAEFVRVLFNEDGSYGTTGRLIGTSMSTFRMDLEAGIDNARALQFKEKAEKGKDYIPLVNYDSYIRNSATFTFPYGKTSKSRKSIRVQVVDGVYTFSDVSKGDGSALKVDTYGLSMMLNSVGFNLINPRMAGKLVDETPNTLGSVLMGLAEYFSNPDLVTPFRAEKFTNWKSLSEIIEGMASVESAYQYKLLNGERVNLQSLSPVYTRNNQKIKQYSSSEVNGPMKALDVVRTESRTVEPERNLRFTGFMLKEGFISEDGQYARHVTRFTDKEQLKYDYHHLYLGFLLRNVVSGTRANQQTLAFAPLPFSDKGSAGVVKATADFLLNSQRIGGKLNIPAMRARALQQINDYYKQLGVSIWNEWNKALISNLGPENRLPLTPIVQSVDSILNALNDINIKIASLTPEQKQILLNSGDLVPELHYDTKSGSIGPIKTSIFEKIDPVALQAKLDKDLEYFKSDLFTLNVGSAPYTLELNMSQDEAAESFFWNRNWVTHNFTALNIGAIEQYKSGSEYADAIKRASQVSTPRMRMVTRDSANQTDLIEGRKLGKFSYTAIISDFKDLLDPISYNMPRGISQKIYDGAAFHNNFSSLMYKASLGGNQGFNVGANLKPISTYMDENTAAVRYDKYASFKITRQMIEEGDDFIVAIDRLMKHTIKFSENGVAPIAVGNVFVDSVYELENAAIAQGWDEEQIMDFMVQNGVQDLFITEVIFDSSVKTGATKVNRFANRDSLITSDSLNYISRSNEEFGLVLDASHDSDAQKGRLSGQHISAMLQTKETQKQAENIVEAIRIIGKKGRAEVVNDDYLSRIRQALNSRNTVGMIQQIVNVNSPSMSNKMLMSMGYSNLASALSGLSIGFSVFGGQQVLAPATGVWRVDTATGFTRTAQSKRLGGDSRELKGFDATRNGNSIKDTDAWKNLKIAVDSNADPLIIKGLREQLYAELETGGWEIQPVEVVISPIHFSSFGIPSGTHISEITERFFALQDKERMLKNFKVSYISDKALRDEYIKAREANDADTLAAIEDQVTTKRVEDRADTYIRKKQDFDKSLQLMIGRIPATYLHSNTPMKVVGFAHDVDNTFYVHPDVLVFHGADQDIDKGNIYAYEPESGKINIPSFDNGVWTLDGKNLTEEELTVTQLKNYILSQIWEAYMIPQTAMTSTMPTGTTNLDKAIENTPEQTAGQSIYNPGTSAQFYTRGQGGRTSTGITAVGLKEYSSMIFSARKRGKNYRYHVPKSEYLSRNGQFAEITDDIEALITFDEVLQAALDNAKDPKLGRANINEHNNALISALALHGYMPGQIIQFISDPNVKEIFDQYAKTKEFSSSFTERPKLLEIISQSPLRQTPLIDDLYYFQSFAEKMTNLGKVLAINRELPNDPFVAFGLKDAFDSFIADINIPLPTFEQFITSSDTEREMAIKQFNDYAAQANVPIGIYYPINIYEVINDNKHIFSYLESFVELDSMFRAKSVMYNDIMNGSKQLQGMINSEESFNSYIDMMYGFAVDAYLNRRGDSAIVVMGGQKYDLRRHISTSEIKGRNAFMADLPNFFHRLTPAYNEKGGNNFNQNLKLFLMTGLFGNTTLLKPVGNMREFSVEKKARVKESMSTADNQFNTLKGDTSLKRMLFLYSLIKDKCGVSGTNFTEFFDYVGDGFYDFDRELEQNPLSNIIPYLFDNNREDFRKLFKTFGKGQKLSKEERENKEFMSTRKFMKENSHAIPYSGNITTNDLFKYDQAPPISAKDVVPVTGDDITISQLLNDFDTIANSSIGKLFSELFAKKNPPPSSQPSTQSAGNVKSQKNYMDPALRRAVSYNTNRNMISSFASKLGKRFGVSTQILNTAEIREQYSADLSTRKGFTVGNTVVINSDLMTIDTPIHEFTHIWMNGLRKEDPELYDRIIAEASKHPYMATVRDAYPELDEEGVAEEVFVTLTGLYNSGKVSSKLNRDFFSKARNLFDRFINWIKQTFSDIFGGEISVNDSLTDIMGQLGESMISAMDMSQDDARTLNLLGINLIAGNSELSALRERMRLQKRYEKIC